MNLEFSDATPDVRTVAAREKTPNPFTEVIASIALKTYEGRPVSKSFDAPIPEGDEPQTFGNRLKRQLEDAGAANVPPVTVPVRLSFPEAGKVTVRFWTTKKIYRPKSAPAV